MELQAACPSPSRRSRACHRRGRGDGTRPVGRSSVARHVLHRCGAWRTLRSGGVGRASAAPERRRAARRAQCAAHPSSSNSACSRSRAASTTRTSSRSKGWRSRCRWLDVLPSDDRASALSRRAADPTGIPWTSRTIVDPGSTRLTGPCRGPSALIHIPERQASRVRCCPPDRARGGNSRARRRSHRHGASRGWHAGRSGTVNLPARSR